MSDFEKLINASDLIEWIIETDPDWCVGSVRCIIDHIDKMPSAQPDSKELSSTHKALDTIEPEIVRCKDCKWFHDIGCAIQIVDDSDKPSENDYCSFAERRTDEHID